MQVSSQVRPVLVILHALAIVLGSYVFTACFSVLASTALVVLSGLPRGDAVLWITMASFLLYLAVLIWAFAASAKIVWTFLSLGTLVCWGLFLYLQPDLVLQISSNGF